MNANGVPGVCQVHRLWSCRGRNGIARPASDVEPVPLSAASFTSRCVPVHPAAPIAHHDVGPRVPLHLCFLDGRGPLPLSRSAPDDVAVAVVARHVCVPARSGPNPWLHPQQLTHSQRRQWCFTDEAAACL